MKSSIYISTEKIEVIGYAGRSVKRFATYPLPEGTMINGMITDATFLTECLTAMKAENPDLFNAPSLIVDGSAILSRRLITPKLSHKRYLQLVRDDFADSTENTASLVCGYHKLKTKAEDAILACAVDKGLVDAYISTFKSAGIKLSSIHIGVEALISLIDSSPELKNASFVLTLVDGFTAVSMIFENGNNVFMSRARLYGETKEQVFQNVLDNLNGLINFNRSQKFSEITQCYYLGVNDADVNLLGALNPYVGIRMSILDLFGGGSVPPEAHFAYLNTLMPSDSIDLIAGRKELDKHVKSKKPKKRWPLFVLLYLLILAAPITFMWWQVNNLDADIAEINKKLNNPDNESVQEELINLELETAAYNKVDAQYRDLQYWEESLPEISSGMLDLFFVQHRELAFVTNFEYDRNTNTVMISALSLDILHPGVTPYVATHYVDAIKESEMVGSIPFEGYDAVFSGDEYIGTRITIEVRLALNEVTGEGAE
jgi:hypothetical protein